MTSAWRASAGIWRTLSELPDSIRAAPQKSGGAALESETLSDARAEVVAAFERAYANRILEATKGRVGESAKRAGINQRHLYDLMKRHGLRKEDFKLR